MKRITTFSRYRRHRMVLVFGAAALLMLAVASSAFPAVPQLINFQGILKDSLGNPVPNAMYSVTFRIWDDSSGGNVLWQENQTAATTNGLFRVLLGTFTPVPDSAFNNPNRWLGIKVTPDINEMTPRQQLVSMGYAYRSDRVTTVDGASGGTIRGTVNFDEIKVGYTATIGQGNTIAGSFAFVAGQNNTASGRTSTVCGGYQNTASGLDAFVGGGSENTASGNESFAAGRGAQAITDGSFVWADDRGPFAPFPSTAANQFLIRASGGVGIGTNSPTQQLDVNGNIALSGTHLVYNTANGVIDWGPGGDLFFRRLSTQGNIGSFSERMVIKDDGKVGIGTIAPSEKLHVVGNICATGTIGACSDIRFKRSIQPLEGALNKVEQLRGVSYQWNREKYPQFSEGKQIGFVAQEVQEVVPEVVSKGSDGTLSVDYGRMTAVLLEAMKAQQAQIETLQQKVKQLSENKENK